MWRYKVALEILSVLQISSIVLFLSLYKAAAICAFLGVSAFGRPPCRPRALAAFSPACVRSRMISRSNSASAPKMWKISFPPDVVVSIELGNRFEADMAVVEAGDRLDEVLEGSAKPIQAPDDQSVACPDVVEGFVQSGALRSALAPDAVSVKILLQPTFSRASFCRSRVWSVVDTRA